MLYQLSVRNPFDSNNMIYTSQDKCLSELVRQANRAITKNLTEDEMIELRRFKKVRKNSRNVEDVLNLTTISKLLNRPKECSLFYRMLVQCSTSSQASQE